MNLTPAQWRILVELDEPTKSPDGFWYFPAKNLRTLKSLASLGLAIAGEWDCQRYGYKLSASGKSELCKAGLGWRP